MDDTISRQTAISAICNACGKIDCDKMDKCEKLQLPPANCSEFPNNSDTISRQQAIDIERNATVDTNPSHFEAHQKFTQFMDDAEISSFGRWQWSNGFNTALTAVGIDLKKLPSAQPDIIRCCECKYLQCNMRPDGYLPKGVDEFECRHWCGSCDPMDFCSQAERKEETT